MYFWVYCKAVPSAHWQGLFHPSFGSPSTSNVFTVIRRLTKAVSSWRWKRIRKFPRNYSYKFYKSIKKMNWRLQKEISNMCNAETTMHSYPQKCCPQGHWPIEMVHVAPTFIIGENNEIENCAFGRTKVVWGGPCSCFANNSTLREDWKIVIKVWENIKDHRAILCWTVHVQVFCPDTVCLYNFEDVLRVKAVNWTLWDARER